MLELRSREAICKQCSCWLVQFDRLHSKKAGLREEKIEVQHIMIKLRSALHMPMHPVEQRLDYGRRLMSCDTLNPCEQCRCWCMQVDRLHSENKKSRQSCGDLHMPMQPAKQMLGQAQSQMSCDTAFYMQFRHWFTQVDRLHSEKSGLQKHKTKLQCTMTNLGSAFPMPMHLVTQKLVYTQSYRYCDRPDSCKQCRCWLVQVDRLHSEKAGLQKEKTELQRTVTELGSSIDKMHRDKVAMESQMEMEEEGIVNRLNRCPVGLSAVLVAGHAANVLVSAASVVAAAFTGAAVAAAAIGAAVATAASLLLLWLLLPLLLPLLLLLIWLLTLVAPLC